MKALPICFALSITIVVIMVGLPPSVFSNIALLLLGIALLYFGNQAVKPTPWVEPDQAEGASSSSDTKLNERLIERITENLKSEPSEQLHEILVQGVNRGGKWSAEAVEAARLLLEQRSNGLASEPVYRTVPRTELEQSARSREATAPGFSRQLLMLDVGSSVYCSWRGQSGTIIRWQDGEERFYIRYNNGEGEWATLGMFE